MQIFHKYNRTIPTSTEPKVEVLLGNGQQLTEAELRQGMLELQADMEEVKAWKEEMDLWMEHMVKVFRERRE